MHPFYGNRITFILLQMYQGRTTGGNSGWWRKQSDSDEDALDHVLWRLIWLSRVWRIKHDSFTIKPRVWEVSRFVEIDSFNVCDERDWEMWRKVRIVPSAGLWRSAGYMHPGICGNFREYKICMNVVCAGSIWLCAGSWYVRDCNFSRFSKFAELYVICAGLVHVRIVMCAWLWYYLRD